MKTYLLYNTSIFIFVLFIFPLMIDSLLMNLAKLSPSSSPAGLS
jgi:hypothetical protein